MHTPGFLRRRIARGASIACGLTLLLPALLTAQIGERSTQQTATPERSSSRMNLPDLSSAKKGLETSITTVPMDGPVNPATYIVGPNDVFTVGIWGPVTLQLPIVVNPEGSMIIPSVGEIPAAGRLLSDVKADAIKKVRSRYTMGDISVTLSAPRTFIVSLRGSVISAGTYTVSAVDRVEKVVRTGATVTNPTPTLSLVGQSMLETRPGDEITVPRVEQAMSLYEKTSTRNIIVVHRTKDTARIDLAMYEATSDDKYNPYLRDGDAIIVPPRDLERGFVSIQGAVNTPGKYEFVEGDRLSTIIAIAHGVTSDASGTAIISRLGSDGNVQSEQRIELSGVRPGGAGDVALERADRVLIVRTVDKRGDFHVTIRGEVAVPGTYPISRGDTRLMSAIESAGGFTQRALPSGSLVFRKLDRLTKDISIRYELMRNWRAAQFNIVDSLYYLQTVREGRAPVTVDIAAMIKGDASQNIVLEDGDIIFIANDRRSVLIDGQVAHPGYQPWVPGASLEHYLKAAGGTTEWAIEGDIRVVKSGTLEWVDPDETKIESGDQIWVPKKIPRDLTYFLSVFRDVATVMTAIATVGILVYNLQKK